MSAATAMVSIGDTGVLNRELSQPLAEVWLDRDLGWLDFNDRVLAEALDDRNPLLERVKFLAIFTSNLDEFFMKRVSVLRRGNTPERLKLRKQIRDRLIQSLGRQAECFRRLVPGLAAHGVHLETWDELTPAQQDEARHYFDSEISPALTPLVFDPAHPFPFLSNLSTSLAFLLHDPRKQTASYARVKVPAVLKQWIPLETGVAAGQKVFVPLHEVIRGNIHKLYDGMTLTGTTLFRLTRDAEVGIDDESQEALPDVVREQIRQRRYEPVIRIELAPGADPSIREMLQQRFKLSPLDVYDLPGELDYTSMFLIASLPFAALRDPAWEPLPPAAFENSHDIFAAIRAGDVLVHHPYERFEDSVECFIAAAANDPETVAVKMTAYRVGDDTPFVKQLVKAAEAGKQVACAIEIKARFDEERNLHWAAELERAGAHVTFGVQGLKTHAKLALVVRKELSGLRTYVHIGTGNYHVRTARLYADVGLFTCDPVVTRDAVNLFHYLTGHSQSPAYSALLVAPTTMRPRLIELIRREVTNKSAGLPARIVAKMNQLEDPEMIEALCEAASAGVPIDLIVRGFCCLRPGVPGRSGGISPILDDAAKQKLWTILDICLRDRRQAWVLGEDGKYSQLHSAAEGSGPEAIGTHAALMELALQCPLEFSPAKRPRACPA